MTNADVIGLAGAGLGDDIVIAKIQAAPASAFDTSLDGLKALKAAGISSAVIKVMISPKAAAVAVANAPPGDPNDPESPHAPESLHAPGVYALVHKADGDHMVKLSYVLPKLVTFAATKHKAFLDGTHASIEFQDSNPTFYIYPAEADATGDVFIKSLVMVKLSEEKQARGLVIGRTYWTDKPGVDDNVKQESTTVQIKPGVYKTTLTKSLPPGEYAFYKADTKDTDGGSYYEFGIGGKP